MTSAPPPDLSGDVADLQAQVRGLTRDLGELQQQLDQLAVLGTAPGAPAWTGPSATNAGSGPAQGSDPKSLPHILQLTDPTEFRQALAALATWVDDYFVPTYVAGRPVKPITPWCPRWWQHPEAIARLEALHLAFEDLVASPKAKRTGRATWLTTCVDPMLAELRSPTGPFVRCTTDPDHPKHTDPEPFLVARYTPPPSTGHPASPSTWASPGSAS